ncbi:MAG: TolC family protein [Halothiobacillaceae bacterium]
MKPRILALWGCGLGAVLLGLIGCASNAEHMASSSADKPWVPGGDEQKIVWSLAKPSVPAAQGMADFRIPANPKLALLAQPVGYDPERVYRLPELIDLAQRNHPATRVAWQQARQAALAVGAVEATFLPMLSASVIAGRQELATPLPEVLGQSLRLDSTEKGSTQILALQWLLFDFGQREALAAAAKHVALAANTLFNGSHQKLIFEVAQAYYMYAATIERHQFARTALDNAVAIQAAVDARRSQGLATTVETAQARQAVAQAKLRMVQTEGQERDAYQVLLASVGVQIPLKLDASEVAARTLPAPSSAPLDATIEQALAKRPDVAASYANLLAGKAAIDAAKADFFPKIYAAGNLAWGSGRFDAAGLPTIGQQGSGSGVLLGVTLPLFDGGLREARLKGAKSRAAMAEDEFLRVQTAALTEIIIARNALRTALESHRAATELVSAATITYDAALDAYRNGVGTVDVAMAANTALIAAREAMMDAHSASLIGAVRLAFMLGALTSREGV